MSEVLGQGVIELVGDARKLKASIEDAKKSIRTLGEGQKDISASAARSIDHYISRLQQQSQTLGKTERETQLFKLALRGASNEQLATADSALKVIERHRAWTAIGNEAERVLQRLAIGATALGAAYGALVIHNIGLADHLKDLSKSTAINVEDLAGLSLLAKQTGTDIDGLAKGINKMLVEMGKAPEDFRALGITAKDPVGAFKQLSDLFNQLDDVQRRNALSQRIFGKSWEELAPVLSEGGQKIGEAVEKGKRLSGITREMADRADEFNDSLEELKVAFSALGNEAVPTLTRIAKEMLVARENSTGWIEALKKFFSIGGDQAADPVAAIETIDKKLEDLRRTADDFSKMGVIKRIFSSDDIAIVNAQIAALEKQRTVLANLRAGVGGGVKPTSIAAPAAQPAQGQGAAARAAAFLKEGEDQIKIIRQIEAERQSAIDKSISLELAQKQVALSVNADLVANQRELQRAELEAITKRVEAAKNAFQTEVQIVLARNATAKESNLGQLAAANKLYDTLIARNNDYLNVYRANQQKIISLDKQREDNRKSAEEAIFGIQLQGLTSEQQTQAKIARGWDLIAQQRAAVLSGDHDQAAKLRDNIVSIGQNVSGGAGIALIQKAADLLDLSAAKQKLAQQEIARTAALAGEANKKTIDDLSQKIKELEDKLLLQIKTEVSQDSLKKLIADIQGTFDREEFTIKAQIVADAKATLAAPAFAAGGQASPGLALVGERGPELVRFLAPAQVYSAQDTRKIFAEFHGMTVRAMAGGGVISAPAATTNHSGGVRDAVDLNLHVGGEKYRTVSERDDVRRLVRAIRIAKRGT